VIGEPFSRDDELGFVAAHAPARSARQQQSGDHTPTVSCRAAMAALSTVAAEPKLRRRQRSVP
jgi:hypothetical protein